MPEFETDAKWGEIVPQELKPGRLSTEIYVVAAVLLPWFCNQLGIDLSGVIGDPDELRKTIAAAHGTGDMPVWVAAAYVIGRKVLKWRAMK